MALVPLAVGLMVYGLAVWWLLPTNAGLATWMLAAFLVGHGWVHIMFAVPAPAGDDAAADAFQVGPERSWLVTTFGVAVGSVRAVSIALVVAIVIAFMLAGLATVNLVVPQSWWSALVVAGALLSTLLMVLRFGLVLMLGFAINAVLLWVAIVAAWSPGVAL
jgi:hypothetical protein